MTDPNPPMQPPSAPGTGRPPNWSLPEPSLAWPVTAGPAAPAKKRHPVLTHSAVGLIALFVGVGIGSRGGASSDGKQAADATPTTSVTTDASPTKTLAATTAPEPAPTTPPSPKEAGPATAFDGDGEYLVGEDIAPGTYKTAGPQDQIPCYWERDKDSSGSFGAIIANDSVSGVGRVSLRTGEVFKTERCQTWKKVG